MTGVQTCALPIYETRLTNVEGGSSGLQSLNSVLAVGNSANNQSITGLNAVGCASLTASGNVSGSNITVMQNYINLLKQLVLSLSKSLELKSPDGSENFDYTGLLP